MVFLTKPRRARPVDGTYEALVRRFRAQLGAPRCAVLQYGVEDVFLRFGPVVVRSAGVSNRRSGAVFLTSRSMIDLCFSVEGGVLNVFVLVS